MSTDLLIETLPEAGQELDSENQGPVEFVELTWEERRRPRRRMLTTSGTAFALALKRGTILCEGTTLLRSPERTIVVKAKAEPLLKICPQTIGEAMKVAHHLGNWHRSAQIAQETGHSTHSHSGGVILTQPDSPLEEWLTRQAIAFSRVESTYHPDLTGSDHD